MTTEERISKALQAEGILSPNVLAYALATIKHETGGRMEPVREGFSDAVGRSEARKRGYGGGENYYGRGYIQLTHLGNYKAIGQRIGLGDELANNPDLALDPDISAKILAAFFKDKGVAKAAESGDFYGARRGVNGTDKADKIAQLAKQYLPAAQKMVEDIGSGKLNDDSAKQLDTKQKQAYDLFKGMIVPMPVKATDGKEVVPYSQEDWEVKQQNIMNESVKNGNYAGKSQGSYQLKYGDTLSGLAKAYNSTVADFMRANPSIKDANKINAGAIINVPSSPIKPNYSSNKTIASVPLKTNGVTSSVANPYPTPVKTTGSYVIRSGDNLSTIARNLGTTVGELSRKNNIVNPNLIYAGVKLKV